MGELEMAHRLAHLLVETLEELDPQWPPRPELDLDGMRAALAAG